MDKSKENPFLNAAKDILLKVLLAENNLAEKFENEDYRASFRLNIGEVIHKTYDFSDSTHSPEAIADEIMDAIIETVRTYSGEDE